MAKKRYKVTGVPQPQNNGEPKGRKKERFVEGTYDPNEMAGYMMEEQEVVVPGEASAWGKARQAYKERLSEEEYVQRRKKQYLLLNPGMNRAAGVTMDRFPANVEENFRKDYRYKTNTAVVKKVGKQEGWNPNKRKEYIDDLNETQKQIVAESKFGPQLQPNYWDRALAGVATLVSPFSSGVQRMMNEGYMPGLTQKESQELLNRKVAGIPIGGLEVVTPFLQSIGQNVANVAKNTGLSYGSDYKDIPGLASGYSMPNVSETDALGLDPFTYIGLPEGIAALGRGALNLGKGAVNLGKTGINAAKRYGYGQDLSNFRFTDEASDFLRADDLRPQSASNSTPAPKPKAIDTNVPLYRVEPQGAQYPTSTNKYADAYNDWIYGNADEFTKEKLAEILSSDPGAAVFTDADGVQKVGSFFPQHTEGNWWSSVPMGNPGSPMSVSTTGGYSGPISELTVQVPYSQLQKFRAADDPLAKQFLGYEDLEYVLPPEYRQKATVVDQATRKPINLDEVINDEAVAAFDPSSNEMAKAFNQAEYESQNERIAQNIDEFIMRKMDLWDTAEGERRLQNMIDNSPGLAGQTPETLREKLFELGNINFHYAQELEANAAIEAQMNQLEILYNEGKMSLEDYRDGFAELDNELQVSDTRLSNAKKAFESGAFYSDNANALGIQPGLFNYDEVRNAVAHEFGHFTTSGAGTSKQLTNLDNQLSDLDLVDDVSEQLTIPGFQDKGTGAYAFYGPGKGPGYVKQAKNYFQTGSNGTEKVPFIAEVRERMLQDGVLKNEYDNITPQMLKDYYNQYKNTRGPKYPIRLLDIVKNKPKNFNIMSEVLNNLPMIAAGTAVAYNELKNDTDDDSTITEASMLGLLGLLAKKPGTFTMPKKLQGIVNNFNKYGATALKELKRSNIKYVKNEIFKLEREWEDIATEVGTRQSGLTKDLDILESKVFDRREKFKKFLDKRDRKPSTTLDVNSPFVNPFSPSKSKLELAMENKNKQVAAYNEAANAYGITAGNTITTKDQSLFQGVTTTGSKPVTDLSTGQTVNAEVKLPGYTQEYKVVDGELVKTDWSIDKPVISQEYITALKNSRNDVETKIPGAKVFGSSVLVTEAGMPHITGDIDVLITQSDYDSKVKNVFGFVQDYGPSKQHAIYPAYGQEGILDFNIIHEDANGMVIPFDNPMTVGKTPLEIELFRQFYPKQFQEASIEAMLTGKPLQINMSSKDFMAGIDPQIKTVIDSYETSPVSKWGMYNVNKEKHILRPDILIAYGNPEVVAKGQLAYIQSIVGENGTLGHQFKPEQLSDVNKNVDALLKINYQGDVLQTASNPERMQLALNDYYINNTVFSREITASSLPGNMYTQPLVKAALTEWFPGKGGSFHGIGLNTVQKGNPTHIDKALNPVIGHRQLGLKLDTSDPLTYVESIIKGTSGSYNFTPEETKILQDLIDKYIPEVKTQIPTNVRSRDILDINPSSNFAKSKDFLEELAKETGIRAIRKEEGMAGGYGTANAQYASLLDKYDELADAMMYSLKEYHAAPKTFAERKRAMQDIKKGSSSSSFPVQTKKDFDKLYSILDGGLQTAQARLSQITDELLALNDYKENLIKNMSNEDDVALKQLQIKINDLEGRQFNISVVEIPALQNKVRHLKEFYKIVGLGSLGGGIIIGGIKAYEYEQDKRSKEYKQDYQKYLESGFEEAKGVLKARGFDISKYNPQVTKDPQLRALLLELKDNPWAQEWSNGEPVEFKNGKIVKPKGLTKKTYYNNTVYILEKPKSINKKQYGGQATIEMELTPKEIQDYVSKGYVVIEQ